MDAVAYDVRSGVEGIEAGIVAVQVHHTADHPRLDPLCRWLFIPSVMPRAKAIITRDTDLNVQNVMA
jgi:hypothetical protein